MNSTTKVLGAVIMLFMVTASVVSAQSFLGPMIGYSLSTTSREDVASYGSPTRLSYGLKYAGVVRRSTELIASIAYRSEDGGFVSPFKATSSFGSNGMINVVDAPGAGPSVVSSLSTSSVEVQLGLRAPMARIDSAGSYVGFTVGLFADALLRAEQQDDYSGIPTLDRGDLPVRVATTYDTQLGCGFTVGGSLVLVTSAGRLTLDLAYLLRQPDSVPLPEVRIGGPKTQYVGWLVGSGLRLSAAMEFAL